MDKRVKILIMILVLIGLLLIFYFATKAITRYTGYITTSSISSDIDEEKVSLAKCLSTRAVMYGAYWCSHCQNQKKMFGNAFEYITYVECDERGENSKPEMCLAKGISGYPTWEIDGKLYTGEKSLNELEVLSGCNLN